MADRLLLQYGVLAISIAFPYRWFKHVFTAISLVTIGLLVLNLLKPSIDLLPCAIQELTAFLDLSLPVLK